MKKFLKVVQALILVTVMVFSLIGCKQKEETTTDNTSGVTQTPTQAAETPTTAPTPTVAPTQGPTDPTAKYAPIDMGGRTFYFSYNYDQVDTSQPAPDPASASAEQIARYANLQRIEQKYNCKIRFVNTPDDQTAEKLTTSVLAGKPFADGVNVGPSIIFAAALNNQLLKVSEYAPANADILNNQEVLVSPGKILGDEYIMTEKNVPISGKFIGVNNDIVNALGMDTPQQLYKNGQWNWDNFEKIAKAATKDTDGDSVVDQWGYAGVPQLFLQQVVTSNDGYFMDDVNGTQGLDNPKTMKAIEFMNQLYNVDKAAYVNNNDVFDWGGNADFYKQGKAAMFYVETWMLPDGGQGLFNYSIVPFPVGPDNTSGDTYATSPWGMVIPRGVEHPDWVYMVYEEMSDWYGADYSQKEQGTMDWLATKYLTQDDVNTCVDVSGNQVAVDNSTNIPSFPLGNILQGICKDGKTVAQTVEETKQVAQDAINAVYKK